MKPLVLVVPFIALFAFAGDTKPTVSKSPMDADQIAVYQAFLSSYNNGSNARLNLSKRTATLNLAEEKQEPCLKGIEFDPQSHVDSIVHEFDPQAPLQGNFRLIDPEQQRRVIRRSDPGQTIRQGKDVDSAVQAGFAAGLLTLSEVAFDKDHQYAAMSFSFVCGGLCGHGSMIVFEKKDGKWRELKRQCGSWVS
jgi:hypothetical protein